MSKYSTPGGDGGALIGLLERMRKRAQQLTGHPVKIVVIQEAGLDGFWLQPVMPLTRAGAGPTLPVSARRSMNAVGRMAR